MAKRRAPNITACPCGLPGSYLDCCGRLHQGRARAGTAEQLMRSRYSAFAVEDDRYLLESWHPRTRPGRIDFDRSLRWQGLTIVATTGGTPFHTEGTVEFRAAFTRDGRPGELQENSRFVRHEGAWVYLDGTVG